MCALGVEWPTSRLLGMQGPMVGLAEPWKIALGTLVPWQRANKILACNNSWIETSSHSCNKGLCHTMLAFGLEMALDQSSKGHRKNWRSLRKPPKAPWTTNGGVTKRRGWGVKLILLETCETNKLRKGGQKQCVQFTLSLRLEVGDKATKEKVRGKPTMRVASFSN